MSNARFYEQSLKAGELMSIYEKRLATCPVPFTRVQDSITVNEEDAIAFHKYMSEGDK